jgi:beta-glucosidase
MKHEDILKKMSLEEKASLLSGKNFWETMDYPEYGIPSMFLSDGPHGLRKQAAAADQLGLNPSLPATCFPTAVGIADTWNVDLARKVGQALGREARILHVNVLLGPGLNMKRNPRCGRSFEYFSEDPLLAGKLAANMVQGIQSNGVASCIKHYACNSQEERRLSSDSIVDERALREIYTTAFEIAIEEGHPKCVMSAYNKVNGTYANENEHLELDLLRKEFSFDGVVITDWGGENDRIEGLKCRNELEMPGNNGDTDREIVQAVKDGRIPETLVNEAADQIIDLALTTSKAFENLPKPEAGAEGKKGLGIKAYPEIAKEDDEIAKEASDEAMVLLKNEGNLLPLKGTEKVALLGSFAANPRYQGAGSSLVNPTRIDTFLDLWKKEKLPFVGYAEGYDRYGKKKKAKKMAEEALALAKKADVVLFFMGLDEVTESEGLDRDTILLPQNQIDLLHEVRKVAKKVVVLLSSGSVVDTSFDQDCDALLYLSLSGQAGARSLMDLLLGTVCPSGKTSETYPLSYDDVPSKRNYPSLLPVSQYRESIFIGYRYYQKAGVRVKYPFGYGLSYTQFAYSDLRISDDGVRFQVKNVGPVAGKEVAELYVGLRDSKVFRPFRELKGFHKTKLLAPGESEEVYLPFDARTFRYYNVKTGRFEVEGGVYAVEIGASSEDIRLFGYHRVDGTTSLFPYDPALLPHYYNAEISKVTDEEFASLYGRKLAPEAFPFLNKRKNRIALDRNSIFSDLVYARGWVGRLVGKALRSGVRYGEKHNKPFANSIRMGPYSFPMRAISRMMNMPMDCADGLTKVFDGHFFKGFHQFNKGLREKPKYPKEDHYQKKPKAKKK